MKNNIMIAITHTRSSPRWVTLNASQYSGCKGFLQATLFPPASKCVQTKLITQVSMQKTWVIIQTVMFTFECGETEYWRRGRGGQREWWELRGVRDREGGDMELRVIKWEAGWSAAGVRGGNGGGWDLWGGGGGVGRAWGEVNMQLEWVNVHGAPDER